MGTIKQRCQTWPFQYEPCRLLFLFSVFVERTTVGKPINVDLRRMFACRTKRRSVGLSLCLCAESWSYLGKRLN
jgi:hypothetical protein